ncbi:hypothetical protein Lser_V15G37339 [Lactuca serriola]
MQRLKSELQIGSGGVLMIGIWGVGGGGKSTLASSVYGEICREFDGCCFVENIREEASRYGCGKLQEKILSEMNVNRVGGGLRLINNRFCHKKVLIVLDDVDQLDQLKALAGSHDWFGEGSRILITTRDVHVLIAHKVDVIHNISLLNNDEAMKLFHKHAHRDQRPLEDYELLSKEVVSYAGGLPLALTVIGSFLCDKNIHEWKSALARLKDIPNDDIVGKLKISFDGLTKVEKDLFLDIACFFRWEKKDRAMEILDACGFHPVIGVKVLIQKALITVSEYGEFDMHDLVQEMGHYIVRVEHPKNPEKRSRVWEDEDVRKISAMDATTELDKIEAIKACYDSLLLKDQNITPIVANMKNLRYIEWELGDPANPLSNNFPPRELCCLILSRALQKQLWDGCKLLPNLKIMELWCSNLIMTPDFGGLPNLERFKLKGSWYLEEIHPSIGRLEKLVSLCIEGCVRFKTFPPISRLKKLETLSFSYCPELFNLTMIQHQNMDNLPHLHLDNSGNKVASHGKSWTNSFVTWFKCCSSNLPEVECFLEEPSLPHNNMKRIGFQFFHNLKELCLRKLDLSRCDLRNEVIGSDVWVLPNLQELNLAENKFSRLSFRHVQLPRLKWLNVSYCYDLVELSELPLSIAVIIADGCSSLETFGDISNCKWLWKVSVQGGYKLGPLGSDLLLDSILQGNAIQDHFISVTLQHQILKGCVGRLYRGDTFTMRLPHVWMDPHTMRIRLPHDWYNDFCGFLIRVVTSDMNADINIIIKQEPDEDPPFELWQDSKQAGEPKSDGDLKTNVGYVSFNSLRRTTLLNLSYDSISFSIKRYWTSFAVELISRKGKDDLMQTRNVAADCSEFWDDEDDYRKPFRIQHVSKSSINILWRPSDNI